MSRISANLAVLSGKVALLDSMGGLYWFIEI